MRDAQSAKQKRRWNEKHGAGGYQGLVHGVPGDMRIARLDPHFAASRTLLERTPLAIPAAANQSVFKRHGYRFAPRKRVKNKNPGRGLKIEEISGGREVVGTLCSALGSLAVRSGQPKWKKPMTISLYDLSVPTFLQTTRAAGSVLDRAVRHCAEIGTDPDDFVEARLFEDMAPFHFQIESLKNHAVWGLEAAKTGVFAPPPLVGAVPFADLQAMVGRAVTALEALTPDEVNSWSDKNLDIELFRPLDQKNASTSKWGPRTLALTPETYLLTYSLPNFYFHVVTAYNILRTRGVPIGKGDYEGQLRTRPT